VEDILVNVTDCLNNTVLKFVFTLRGTSLNFSSLCQQCCGLIDRSVECMSERNLPLRVRMELLLQLVLFGDKILNVIAFR